VLHDDTTLGTPTVFFQCLAESLTVAPVACHRDPARPAEVFTATSRRVLAVATPPSPSAIALAPPAAP
jgi:hypothetical protein